MLRSRSSAFNAIALVRRHLGYQYNRSFIHEQVGVFGMPSLTSPESFKAMAMATKMKVHALVRKVTSTPEPGIGTLQDLDSISDALCQVVDTAELCRNVHEDAAFRSSVFMICLSVTCAQYETEPEKLPTLYSKNYQRSSRN